jgi:hypothetical protein
MWHVWETGEAHTRFLWGRPEVKILLGRSRHRWENNIKMGLQEVGWDAE